MIHVLSFGDRIETGDYAVQSRFPSAVNFTDGRRLVSVVSPHVGGGPINIVAEGLDWARAERLRVQADAFRLDGETLPKRPVFDSALPPGRIAADRLRDCRRLLLRKAHAKSLAFLLDERRCRSFSSNFEKALVRRFQDAARELRRAELEAGARLARGAGFGLTPSGDDLLSGYLWGLHCGARLGGGDCAADIEKVYGAAKNANPLSAAFLLCARNGRFFERLRDLLGALARADAARLEGRLEALLAVGATSGADTCVGLMLALERHMAVDSSCEDGQCPRAQARQEDRLWSSKV